MSEQAIYLNHAGTSWPKPQVVLDACRDASTRSPIKWGEHFSQAHHDIAKFFGIANPEQLLLTPGCTSSLALAIGDVDLGGCKRVLTSVWEHHAMHRPLLKLGESGVAIEYIPASNDCPLDLGKMEHELKRGDVGLVAITASANVTGDLLPFEEVIKLAHQYGAQVLLDAAQVVGWMDLDCVALEADLVAFGGHKGLQGPWGVGGLYMAEDTRMNCSSARCELPQTNRLPRPGYCDAGSVDQIALAGLHAAVQYLEQAIRTEHITDARKQIALLENTLRAANVRCYGIQEHAQRMPSLAFSVNNRTSTEIANTLKSHGIVVGSGLQCSPLAHQAMGTESEGLVRVSVGVGQNCGDIQAAIELIHDSVLS